MPRPISQIMAHAFIEANFPEGTLTAEQIEAIALLVDEATNAENGRVLGLIQSTIDAAPDAERDPNDPREAERSGALTMLNILLDTLHIDQADRWAQDLPDVVA